jgi:A/G-specific adenine glycosylase
MVVNVSGLFPPGKGKALVKRVLAWWDVNRRELAWRAGPGETPDPYRVWLSEVLLQQTTAQAVAPYYRRFVETWPTVGALAAAPQEAVISAFAGLGYYSRARNLHACAKAVSERGGRFPDAEPELRSLPGVGAYTAAAIAAIAFGRNALPVDGNIARILARLMALETTIPQSRAAIGAAARALAPAAGRPGDFAQALMDIGALVCRPRNPDCPACPLRPDCAAARSGAPDSYPRRAFARAKPLRSGAVFFAERRDGAFLARRRAPSGLLASTVELPGSAWIVGDARLDPESAAPVACPWRKLEGAVEQAFTHFTLSLAVHVGDFDGPAPGGHFWVARHEVDAAGFSNVMRKAALKALAQREAAPELQSAGRSTKKVDRKLIFSPSD